MAAPAEGAPAPAVQVDALLADELLGRGQLFAEEFARLQADAELGRHPWPSGREICHAQSGARHCIRRIPPVIRRLPPERRRRSLLNTTERRR